MTDPHKVQARIPARWYFDVLSPFAYLHLKALPQLDGRLEIEYVPVLLAGLLKHWGQLGPAEIPAKRLYVYRYCTWAAQARGWPLRFPPGHPFNPLPTLRLTIALGATAAVVRSVFDFIYGKGRDPGNAAEWAALCRRLGVDDARAASLIQQPAVKQQLKTNTADAIAAGVFGVPTLACRGELFWGADSLGMLQSFLDDPQFFEHTEMRRLKDVRFDVARRAE